MSFSRLLLPGIIGALVGYGLSYLRTVQTTPVVKISGINREAILHMPTAPYAYAADKRTLHLRLRTGKGNIATAQVIYMDPHDNIEFVRDMRKSGSDDLFDYWLLDVMPPFRRCNYSFHLVGLNGEEVYYNEDRFSSVRPTERGHFKFPYLCSGDVYSPPDWVKDTIWYQIFPERFANGDPTLNPGGTEKWGGIPTRTNFFGGDFQGIIEHIGYLKELGINGIYFTPIFQAPSNHKYDTVDYFQIDPHFGDKAKFKELVNTLHANGMRIMLDCVFNHAGERFPMFEDVKKNGEASKYKDWFYIRKFPIVADPPSYETFAFVGSMPKFNTNNPETRDYLINVATYWIKEFDIDGWRIDVANETDIKFWRLFCSAVRAEKPDVFILGEVWNNALNWIGGDKFDSATNYPLYYGLNNFGNQRSTLTQFQQSIDHIRHWYPETTNNVLFNLLSSHDVARVLTRFNEDVDLTAVAYAFLLTYPGSPCIYYGDEIGITGEQDPGCRKCMIWDPSRYNMYLLESIKKLIRIRKDQPVLRSGTFEWLSVSDAFKYAAFKRESDTDKIIFLFRLDSAPAITEVNLRTIDQTIKAEEGEDLFNGKKENLKKVFVNSKSFRIIKVPK